MDSYLSRRAQLRPAALAHRQRGFIINPYAFAVGSGDPYWANVVALLHFDGANNSTTFTDQTGKTWTRNNSPIISTSQSVFGGASGRFNGGGSLEYIKTPSATDWLFGSGDFTLEGRTYFSSISGNRGFFAKEDSSGYSPWLLYRAAADFRFYATSTTGSFDISNAKSFGTVSALTWYAWAVTRSGSNWNMYLNGTRVQTFTSSASVMSTSDQVKIGGYFDSGGTSFDGFIDEVRVTKGVARYTGASYTLAGAAFPNS